MSYYQDSTYSSRLFNAHMRELEADAQQDTPEYAPGEYAQVCLGTINSCLRSVSTSENLISRNLDVAHQQRIIKAQRRPITWNVDRLKAIGKEHLIPQAAYDFLSRE